MFLTVWGVGENSDRAEHDDTMNVRNVTPATPLPRGTWKPATRKLLAKITWRLSPPT